MRWRHCRNKSNAMDAEAICEAVRRPGIHFVPLNSMENQTLLDPHRAKQAFSSPHLARVLEMAAQDSSTLLARRLRRYSAAAVLCADEVGY
jgi:hypothetical protein